MTLQCEAVVLSGRLAGMGHETSCTLNAVPGTILAHFAHCSIKHAPINLPDGEYLFTFDGGMNAGRKARRGVASSRKLTSVIARRLQAETR